MLIENKTNAQNQEHKQLNVLTVISTAFGAELKKISAGLSTYADDPTISRFSDQFGMLQRAASFCGYWSVASFVGAMRELALLIEREPMEVIGRPEFIDRVKTLGTGVTALTDYLKDISKGLNASNAPVNERFRFIIRKCRPTLLDLEIQDAKEIFFMPVPLSLEVEASWRASPGASRQAFLSAARFSLATGLTGMQELVNANPYPGLSGLLEGFASQRACVDKFEVSVLVKEELERLVEAVSLHDPVVSPAPDAFLISRLLYAAAHNLDNEPGNLAFRKRFSLLNPAVMKNHDGVINMHGLAKEYAASIQKIHNAFQQASLMRAHARATLAVDVLKAEAAKIGIETFTQLTSLLEREVVQLAEVAQKDDDREVQERLAMSNAPHAEQAAFRQSPETSEAWIRCAQVLSLIKEAVETWSSPESQEGLLKITARASNDGVIDVCRTVQTRTRDLAIAKIAAWLTSDLNSLKTAIDMTFRQATDKTLKYENAVLYADMVCNKARPIFSQIVGVMEVLGLVRAATFAEHVQATICDGNSWTTPESRTAMFDLISRYGVFIQRLRPGTLIDIQPEESGVQADLACSIEGDDLPVIFSEEPLDPDGVDANLGHATVHEFVEQVSSDAKVDADSQPPAKMESIVAEPESILGVISPATFAENVVHQDAQQLEGPEPVFIAEAESNRVHAKNDAGEASAVLEADPTVESREVLGSLAEIITPDVSLEPEVEPTVLVEVAVTSAAEYVSASDFDSSSKGDSSEVTVADPDLTVDAEVGPGPQVEETPPAPSGAAAAGVDVVVEVSGASAPSAEPVLRLVGFNSISDEALSPPRSVSELTQDFLAAGEPALDNINGIDDELAKVLMEESERCLSAIFLGLGDIEDAPEEERDEILSSIKREIHTLKGACRTCGLLRAGSIFHAMEDEMDLAAGSVPRFMETKRAFEAGMEGARDLLETFRSEFGGQGTPSAGSAPNEATAVGVEHVPDSHLQPDPESGPASGPEHISAVDPRFAPVANHLQLLAAPEEMEEGRAIIAPEAISQQIDDVAAADTAPTPGPVSGLESAPSLIDVTTSASAPSQAALPAHASVLAKKATNTPLVDDSLRAIRSNSKVKKPTEETVRLPISLVSQVGDASSHVLMSSRKIQESIERLRKVAKSLESNVNRMTGALRALEITATAKISATSSSASAAAGFDPLELDRYTSLQETIRSLSETHQDVLTDITALKSELNDVRRDESDLSEIGDTLQRDSSGMMLMPLSTQLTRLVSVVERANADAGKEIQLDVDRDCRVPAAAMDKLMPVFEHILRNSVAHGIESDRAAAGKDRVGRILISHPDTAVESGGVINISVRDDGAGINHDLVLNTALARGIAKPGKDYSRQEIREFIFAHGFSTSEKVSQLSGRGVGLDVVRDTVSKLGGVITLGTEEGVGTEFTITIPTDAATMVTLPVSSGGFSVMLPISIIKEILPLGAGSSDRVEVGDFGVKVDGQVIDIVPLRTKVPGSDRPGTANFSGAYGGLASGQLILMREGGGTRGVLVDFVRMQSRVVVTTLGPFVKGIPGFIAGTVLDDGSVGLIVNPIRMAYVAEMPGHLPAPDAKKRASKVMIVDDSPSMRLVTGRVVKRMGYDIETCADGFEALERLKNGLNVSAFLIDLEMPGMDGFELMTQLRRRIDSQETPIVVISSRTADKHKQRAFSLGASEYLAKPYDESALERVLDTFVAR